jgi:hypothetical protein
MGLFVGIMAIVLVGGAINGASVSKNGARREKNHTGGVLVFCAAIALVIALAAG